MSHSAVNDSFQTPIAARLGRWSRAARLSGRAWSATRLGERTGSAPAPEIVRLPAPGRPHDLRTEVLHSQAQIMRMMR